MNRKTAEQTSSARCARCYGQRDGSGAAEPASVAFRERREVPFSASNASGEGCFGKLPFPQTDLPLDWMRPGSSFYSHGVQLEIRARRKKKASVISKSTRQLQGGKLLIIALFGLIDVGCVPTKQLRL
ncbi:hypothetical protein F2P81_022557 [Scophthalmus maximus]|uniref:Uncharacterized protein n=1 Tax=Scophthalmus maximus TaxID=52904 RepID=A0A6A4RSN3_SCOMX|nr:hypothetical protein F2P81_022557 [Scophthalmus maximus]